MRVRVFPPLDPETLQVRSGFPDGFMVQVGSWVLNVDRTSGHYVTLSEREGWQRWRYLGPVCWRLVRRRRS